MASPSELADYRAALEKARYGGGARVVEIEGRKVEYRSDAELAAAIAAVDRQIAALAAAPVKVIRFTS